jgi:hypothetical protein
MRYAFTFIMVAGCASHSATFETDDSGRSPTDEGGTITGTDSGMLGMGGDSGTQQGGDGGVTTMTTIYANTDDSLYTMDPKTMAVTLVGKFAGLGGGTGDTTVTDVAVDANDEVYVNSESVVYKAAVPMSPGTVQLTKVAAISLKQGQKFYALAFVPAGVLGQNETLVGGDGYGELYSIDTTNGSTKDLGNFGNDSAHVGNIFALSGDVVFYLDANNKPTGLATIRSCTKNTTTCIKTSDFLAGVDMTALATAYKSGTPGALLSGIYGGNMNSSGPGTGYGDLFGLGAWQGNVFAFERKINTSNPQLLSVSTQSGTGSVISSNFAFTNGWSGAGVTTKVTVNVPPPPPPPK